MKRILKIVLLTMVACIAYAGEDKFNKNQDSPSGGSLSSRFWMDLEIMQDGRGVTVVFDTFYDDVEICLSRGHYDNRLGYFVFDGTIFLPAGTREYYDKQAHPNVTYGYVAWQFVPIH